MFRKWFNQAAEIKRLNGQVKHLQGELNIANFDAQGWKKSALKTLVENSKLKNGIQDCIDYETPNANATVRRITNKLRGLL